MFRAEVLRIRHRRIILRCALNTSTVHNFKKPEWTLAAHNFKTVTATAILCEFMKF